MNHTLFLSYQTQATIRTVLWGNQGSTKSAICVQQSQGRIWYENGYGFVCGELNFREMGMVLMEQKLWM